MRLRKVFRKIHRWVGLISALWLLQLTITGLLLQHADSFKLTTTYINSPTILQWFDYGQRQQAWDVDDLTIFQLDDQAKINDSIINIPSPLVGVGHTGSNWVLATANTLYWLNQQGEIINQMDDFDGLPTPVQKMTATYESINIQVNHRWAEINDGIISWHPTTPDIEATKAIQARKLTSSEQGELFSSLLGNKLSYDKVLHGIHSGIKSSSWMNTLSALALLYLCFSGIYLFFKAPRNIQRR
jgi:hypothetical protein